VVREASVARVKEARDYAAAQKALGTEEAKVDSPVLALTSKKM
jgi:hypothetical protein